MTVDSGWPDPIGDLQKWARVSSERAAADADEVIARVAWFNEQQRYVVQCWEKTRPDKRGLLHTRQAWWLASGEIVIASWWPERPRDL